MNKVIEHKFIASNLFTGKPMVFLMDPKVIDTLLEFMSSY